jgi:hypothetical protein
LRVAEHFRHRNGKMANQTGEKLLIPEESRNHFGYRRAPGNGQELSCPPLDGGAVLGLGALGRQIVDARGTMPPFDDRVCAASLLEGMRR